MSAFQIYALILCFIVFAVLTAVSVFVIVYLLKLNVKLIRHGVEDAKLTTEYNKSLQEKGKFTKTLSIIDRVFSVVICVVILGIFTFSSCVNIRKTDVTEGFTLQIVQSGSMSAKYERNTYLFENNLDDQIQTFDIIITHKLPAEEDLQLYDIVVYEVDHTLLIHRIVGIEEPNDQHPGERYFLLKGDNNEYPDRFPVRYSQMKGIYEGQRIPFLGSFVSFMQSPAGYVCVLLVLFATIATPLIEKKLISEKTARLIAIGVIKEENTENEVVENKTDISIAVKSVTVDKKKLNIVSNGLTFKEKLSRSDSVVKNRYREIVSKLLCIDGVRVIESKKAQTFKKGNTPIVKLNIKGKTLNAYLGLNPNDLEGTKYVFTDVSSSSSYNFYPTRVKVSSDRQTRWTNELISLMVKNNGWTVNENANIDFNSLVTSEQEEVAATENVTPKKLNIIGNNFTFKEKLERADKVVKDRYKEILKYVYKIKDVREIESKKAQTFKKGNIPILKLTIRGKTLNAYLGLNPNDLEGTKYVFTDVSNSPSYKFYPTRVKVSSDRQTRWTNELIDRIAKEKGLFTYAISKLIEINGEKLTFKERLSTSTDEVKQRFNAINEHLENMPKVKRREFNAHYAYNRGRIPIAKIKIVGKTLNVYLGLKPKDYKNTKYKFIDVSKVKSHKSYPMRVKITSERQTRWVKELIDKLDK